MKFLKRGEENGIQFHKSIFYYISTNKYIVRIWCIEKIKVLDWMYCSRVVFSIYKPSHSRKISNRLTPKT
ncbi:hypothetical protein FHS19_005950 [Paenibacillus rhizosphaerae]|uniref:Uncharacterized protein n=1 Tax=Paenibacillus rhizosphaerae TaxID=297318 RepID=A0A839U0D8_9BACL|nr:hypothetical protein [Paenibacillus rhizosphaerae]